MRTAFADAGYFVAILNARDSWHVSAAAISQRLSPLRLVTSEASLFEVLDYFAEFGPYLRREAVALVRRIRVDPNIEVVTQTARLLNASIELYARREDKEWGLTDCASFVIMEERGIAEALTHDHHFAQAGFRALLRDQE